MSEAIKAAIRAKALSLGFDDVGFASPEPDPSSGPNLRAYLDDGRHGEMTWMASTAERRADPRVLWPAARTVIALGVNYAPANDPLALLAEPDVGNISVYARGRDYHDVVKTMLKALGRWLAGAYACEVKVFVDTAPVMEKPLAQRAGLGWIGKHTNLVSRRFGSWLFLGEVFTTIELPPDRAGNRSLRQLQPLPGACPTDALAEPYRIEPRRCISYLTIEASSPPAPIAVAALRQPDLRLRRLSRRLPLEQVRGAERARRVTRTPRADRTRTGAVGGCSTKPGFVRMFAGTAVKRIGHERFLRNVRAARPARWQDATLGRASVGEEPTGRERRRGPTWRPGRAPVGSRLRDGVRSGSG